MNLCTLTPLELGQYCIGLEIIGSLVIGASKIGSEKDVARSNIVGPCGAVKRLHSVAIVMACSSDSAIDFNSKVSLM